MKRLDPRDVSFSRFAPRIWHGMTFGAWRTLIHGNLRHVTRDRIGVVASITLLSMGSSLLRWVSDLAYSRQLARVEITPDPVFILGYWRSGTTWLHQLVASDSRFAAPSGLQVFMPETFLVGRWFIKPILSIWVPTKRPMDHVKLGSDTSEEDEVALAVSGAPSVMRRVAFPARPVPDSSLTLSSLDQASQERWFAKWDAFLRKVQLVNPGKWILLKSPNHATRIPEVLKRFPNAKFIHISRDPYKIFQSLQHMRYAMAATQGLSSVAVDPESSRLDSYNEFQAYHDKFHNDLPLIPKSSISFVRYEELRRDPIGEMARVYNELGIGGFEQAEPALRARCEHVKNYVNMSYDLDPSLEEEIWTQAKAYFDHYGYVRMSEREQGAP